MTLEEKFAHRIDTDNGFDNLKLTQDLIKIAEVHYKQALVDIYLTSVEKYSPKPIQLQDFDMTKSDDYVYCVQWGINKAKKHEYEVFQKMLKELKEKN